MRVLPLTHFETTAAGETRVLLFFELIDQWGDTVKGAGALRVRIAMEGIAGVAGTPAGGPGGGGGVNGGRASSVEWEIDLADLERNASLYDPSTRAYRLALRDLPGWLVAASAGSNGGGGSSGQGLVLEVFFKTLGSDGRPAALRDRFVLRRGS